MTHESTARINHRSSYNCSEAVTAAFADELHLSPILNSDQIFKCVPAFIRVNSYKWEKRLTKE